jgi:hypothetical protein
MSTTCHSFSAQQRLPLCVTGTALGKRHQHSVRFSRHPGTYCSWISFLHYCHGTHWIFLPYATQIFTGSFSLGMGGIPWVIMSEVYFLPLTSKDIREHWRRELFRTSRQAEYDYIHLWIQIFPINMKGSAGSLVTLVSWLGSWIISYTFNFLLMWNSYSEFINNYKPE